MDKQIKQFKKDFLEEELKKATVEIVKIQLDIDVLEKADPTMVIAKDVLTTDKDGNATSTRDIPVKTYLERKKKKQEGLVIRLDCIKRLLDNLK